MDRPFLLQMAGPPGVGKSSVARQICARSGAVALDADVIKSSLLGCDVPWDVAGPATYALLFALADDLLANGRSVVIDSPSHYQQVVDSGTSSAARAGAVYAYVELRTDDLDMLGDRMRARTRLPSQMVDLDTWPEGGSSKAVRAGAHAWHNAKPDDAQVLTLAVDPHTSAEDLAHVCLDHLSRRAEAQT